MGFMIEDGRGSGVSAQVDNNYMLHTHAVAESLEHKSNKDGNSFNILFTQTSDTTASNCIIYVKNSFEEDLVFEGLSIRTDKDAHITISLNNTGIPVDGLDITPANLNAGSGTQAEGTFQAGNAITGLSGGYIANQYFIEGGNSSDFYNFDQDIIVPKNRTLTLSCLTDNVIVSGFLSVFRDVMHANM